MENPPAAIKSYSLFGESAHLPDVMHCETIAERSALHDWELSPHRHVNLHQVMLITAGGGVAGLDGEVYPLRASSLINVPAGHVHTFRFKPNTKGWVATFPVELLEEILVGVGDVRTFLAQAAVVPAMPPIRPVMQQIWEEFCGRSNARALVLRGLSATVLGLVSRTLEAASPVRDNMQELDLVQRFKGLVEQHFQARWGVAEYAKALSVSPTHLGRLTRAATGDSPLRLIEARTLREARRYLVYTNLNVSTIAYALGFADPAYFTRAFARDGGISPSAFRAQMAEPAGKSWPR